MAHDADREVPEGAAVLPLIPPELDVHPLLLALLHTVVFLQGSDPSVVQPDAAGETLEYLAAYLQRLDGIDLQRMQADLACLVEYARMEKWPQPEVQFLKHFLDDFGVGEDSQPDNTESE